MTAPVFTVTPPPPLDDEQMTRDELDQLEYDNAVSLKLFDMKVFAEARLQFNAYSIRDAPSMDSIMLRDLLLRPDDEKWRVEGLLGVGARMLLVAQRKTGKTTATLNLARCLLTGELFLNRFSVEPIAGKVAFLNFEVSGNQIARWADEACISPDRFLIINLRGRRNPLANETDRAALVALLREHGVEILIIDPFARAFVGIGENSDNAGQVNTFTSILDTIAMDAGISELILTNHSGWNKERGRNSSALEDWPDCIVNLVKDDDTGQRFLRAEGRDVDVEEDRLDFDPVTRRLSMSGAGSRKVVGNAMRFTTLQASVVSIVNEAPGPLTVDKVEQALRDKGIKFTHGDGSKAAVNAAAAGLILRIKEGRKYLHSAIPPDTARYLPQEAYDTSHTSLKGVGRMDEWEHLSKANTREVSPPNAQQSIHTVADFDPWKSSGPIHACAGKGICQTVGCEAAA